MGMKVPFGMVHKISAEFYHRLKLTLSYRFLNLLRYHFCILQSEKCNKKQSMTKQIKIARCPDILILHLKRFCSSRSKYDQLVHSPTQLKVRDTQFNLTRKDFKLQQMNFVSLDQNSNLNSQKYG